MKPPNRSTRATGHTLPLLVGLVVEAEPRFVHDDALARGAAFRERGAALMP